MPKTEAGNAHQCGGRARCRFDSIFYGWRSLARYRLWQTRRLQNSFYRLGLRRIATGKPRFQSCKSARCGGMDSAGPLETEFTAKERWCDISRRPSRPRRTMVKNESSKNPSIRSKLLLVVDDAPRSGDGTK